jgi:hypothetical protein
MSASLRSIDGQDEATILRKSRAPCATCGLARWRSLCTTPQVVQIERKEKFRLQQPGNKPG